MFDSKERHRDTEKERGQVEVDRWRWTTEVKDLLSHLHNFITLAHFSNNTVSHCTNSSGQGQAANNTFLNALGDCTITAHTHAHARTHTHTCLLSVASCGGEKYYSIE